MAQPEDVEEVWALVLKVYPKARNETSQMLADILDAWKFLLGDLPSDVLRAAVTTYLAERHEWRPLPGHIREIAFDLTSPYGGMTPEERALYVWQDVNEIAREGTYHRNLDDLAAEVIDRLGGWSQFSRERTCHYEGVWWRSNFLKLYAALARQQERERRMLPSVREVRQLYAPPPRPALAAGDEDLDDAKAEDVREEEL